MSYRTCPDWPALMERAPDLQFKHMTVHDAHLPFEVVAKIPGAISLDDVEICCDLEHHVVNALHTHPDVVTALEGTHWFEVNEWATRGPEPTRARAARLRTPPDTPRRRAHVGSSRADGDPVPCRRQEPSAPLGSARVGARDARRRAGGGARAGRRTGRDGRCGAADRARRQGGVAVADPGGGQGAAVVAGSRAPRARASSSTPTFPRDTADANAWLARVGGCARRGGGRDDERARARRLCAISPAVRPRQRLALRCARPPASGVDLRTWRRTSTRVDDLGRLSLPVRSPDNACVESTRGRRHACAVRVVCLSGGVGGAKLARGLYDVLAAGELTVIGNVGDDVEVLGHARLAGPRLGALCARGPQRRGTRLGPCR